MMKHLHLAPLFGAIALFGCTTDTTSPGDTTSQTKPTQAFAACDAKFTITAPDPKRPWTPNAITLVSQRLAPGVFAVYDANVDKYAPLGVPLATSGGFVIGDDGVLLVESMINRQLFCQMVALVRAETTKPVTHVVNTSSHGDHSYGNTFLPSGVHVVQHERTAAYIAASFAEDVAFMEANFGADQGIDEIKPVAADILVKDGAGWSVDLGGVSVSARYHGFAQTGGDLFVSVPSAKVLWTGNALLAEKPGIPWLLAGHAEETGVTLADVKASLPKDAIVVPGHGRAVTVDGFDFSIGYLGALVSGVNDAIAGGLDKEETVSAVTLDAYKGYALWDWIHTTVNVPFTYDELAP